MFWQFTRGLRPKLSPLVLLKQHKTHRLTPTTKHLMANPPRRPVTTELNPLWLRGCHRGWWGCDGASEGQEVRKRSGPGTCRMLSKKLWHGSRGPGPTWPTKTWQPTSWNPQTSIFLLTTSFKPWNRCSSKHQSDASRLKMSIKAV